MKSELVLSDSGLWFESDTSCSLEHSDTCLPVAGAVCGGLGGVAQLRVGLLEEKT